MLAIAGGKGGVGKTTTTLALADALPGRPLVVDADRGMPNLHEMAGVGRCLSLDAFVADADGDSTPADPTPAAEYDCHVVAAPEADAPRTDVLLSRLRHLGRRGTESAVLVDCPAGTSVDAAAPLQVADGVLLVSTACAPVLRDTAKTASMARAVGTPLVGLLLTRTRLPPPGLDSLFDCPVLGSVPPAGTDGRVGDAPLADRRVRNRYQAVAERLVSTAVTN